MERHEASHFSYSPASIKLDIEKVSALTGQFQITAGLTVGVAFRVKANGSMEPQTGALQMGLVPANTR